MTLQKRNRNRNITKFKNLSRKQPRTDIQTMKRKLNNDNDDVIITTKKCVRFFPQVIVSINNDLFSKEEIESYYLSPNNFFNILNNLLMTLNIMKMIGGDGDDKDNDNICYYPSALSSSSLYCSRGIEHYLSDGCLKPLVIMRRQNAINVVLIEQDVERQRQQHQEHQEHQQRGTTKYDKNVAIHNISEAYQNENYLNTVYGIYTGKLDSLQALKAYQERYNTTKNNNYSRSNKNKNKTRSSSTSSMPLPSLPTKNEQMKFISRAA
jgi:hypothetical protein